MPAGARARAGPDGTLERDLERAEAHAASRPQPIRAEDRATPANRGPARRADDEHRVALAAWAWSRPMAEATALSTFQREGEAGRGTCRRERQRRAQRSSRHPQIVEKRH